MRNFLKIAFVLFCAVAILTPSAIVQANKGKTAATAQLTPSQDFKGLELLPFAQAGLCTFECSNGATGSGPSESAGDCACDCAEACGEHCEIEFGEFTLECDPNN